MSDEDIVQHEMRGAMHHRAGDVQSADAGSGSDLDRGDGDDREPQESLESIAEPPTLAAGQPILATPRMSEALSPRLPQELIDRVISFLWNWPPAMDAWKLVSRACYSYVTTFSGILGLSSNAFSVLSHSLTVAEKLRDVHTLFLCDSVTPWLYRVPLRLGPALANVTTLSLFEWSPAARTPLHPAVLPAFAHLRSVTTLTLNECRFESVAQLQRLLGAFPGLRELGLYAVYVPAHKASVEGASSVVCRLPPLLKYLALGSSEKKKPEKREANVVGDLATWFTKDEKRLRELQVLFVRIAYASLQEGELASIGQLIAAVGPHVSMLDLDFAGARSDLSDHAANLGSLKLDSCVKAQTLVVFRSSPESHELSLLFPECRIRTLLLARGTWCSERQATDWTALAAVLEGSAYNELKRVVNYARIPQSPVETEAMRTFIERMHARGVSFEDRTEFPYLGTK